MPEIKDLDSEKVPTIEEADDTVMKVIFTMSKTAWKRLGEIALNRETSRAELVREAIKQYVEKLEKPEEQNPKIPDRKINRILDECTKDDGEGFEIDGEDGFIAKMTEKRLKLKDLTPQQFERVLEKLEVGYAGYWSSPDVDEWVERFEPSLEPTDEQLEKIRAIAEESEEESEEESD